TALRPHLAAAHHLARWLTRTAADAEDALQNAVLRAFRSYDRQRPVNPRAWLLRIVRNCCYDLREQQDREPSRAMLDDDALETVLSRLSRARAQLRRRLGGRRKETA